MRNAKIEDCKNLSPNVMYQVDSPWFGGLLAHIKERVFVFNKWMLAMETSACCQFVADPSWLKPVPRKEGSKPKAKRKPRKGTRPWLAKFEYVDYDLKLIAPGVKVKCRDKKVRVVEAIENGGHLPKPVFRFNDGFRVWISNGKENLSDAIHSSFDIMKILVEKKTEKLDTPSRKVYDSPPCPLKLENDKYCGYAPNVWHFWQGGECPIEESTQIDIWCRGSSAKEVEMNLSTSAGNYYWDWSQQCNDPCDIIAFKIIL